MTPMPDRDQRITVGISTCLLGQKVRFDAGHKRDRYITDILGEFFRFVPVCPEVEVGMGIPREAVRLEGTVDSPRMVGNRTGEDWTARMNTYSHKRVARRDMSRLDGYILKKDSPSCGMERVKLYSSSGTAERKAVGLYTRALLDRFPLLPIEEEGRLNDARIRENFIARVFAHNRLRQLFGHKYSRRAVVDFHTREKYLLMAHSVKHYKELGQLVARVDRLSPDRFGDKYCSLYMEALKIKTTTRKNVNVLQHIMGYLKNHLSAGEKQSILQVIKDYHDNLVPLIVPLTLIRHYIEKFDVRYIIDQVYLNPHPKELMLRNHV